MKSNQIYCGDCLSILPEIEEHSVDMILCDPPFNVTANKWDVPIPLDTLWARYNLIIKPGGAIVLFSSQPFTTALISSNLSGFKYCWYWCKNQGTNFFHAKRMPIRKVEEICVFNSSVYYPQITDGHAPTNSAKGCSNGKTYHGDNKRDYEGGSTTRMPTNILDFKCVDNYSRLHSSEKPVALLEYSIKTYTLEGETVLDSCAGSGSTGVAARNIGRNYILIEKEPQFYEVIQERLSQI